MISTPIMIISSVLSAAGPKGITEFQGRLTRRSPKQSIGWSASPSSVVDLHNERAQQRQQAQYEETTLAMSCCGCGLRHTRIKIGAGYMAARKNTAAANNGNELFKVHAGDIARGWR